MKFLVLIFIILGFCFGYVLNAPYNNEGYQYISNDTLKDFENRIIIPGNDYKKKVIGENKVSSIGQKIEGIIDKGFDMIFDILKSVIGSK